MTDLLFSTCMQWLNDDCGHKKIPSQMFINFAICWYWKALNVRHPFVKGLIQVVVDPKVVYILGLEGGGDLFTYHSPLDKQINTF